MVQAQLLLADLVLVALATACSLALINNFEVSVANVASFAPYLLLTLTAATVVLPSLRTCRSVWRFTGMADYLRILAATAAIIVSAGSLDYWLIAKKSAPALIVLQGLLILFFLVGIRVLVRLGYAARERLAKQKAARQAAVYESILVIGLGGLTDLYLRFLSNFEPHQIRIEGLLGDHESQTGRCVHGYPILGTPEEIAGMLRRLEIHGVVINRIVSTTPFEHLSPQGQAALLGIKKSTNINLVFLTSEMGLARRTQNTARFSADRVPNGFGSISFDAGDLAALTRRSYWLVKQALEPPVALGLLIVLAPLILSVAILTLIDVGFPVTFWQLRPGLYGPLFKLYKFRTMAAAYDAHGSRVPEEERTSAIGHFLRRTRLDELPQLFNILFRQMSFIGPRPLLPIDQPSAYSARLLVRPGLTGWAQVKGGRDISSADKAALDVWYVRNASLSLDLTILALTVLIVVFGEQVDTAAIRLAWQAYQNGWNPGDSRRTLCFGALPAYAAAGWKIENASIRSRRRGSRVQRMIEAIYVAAVRLRLALTRRSF